MAGICFGRGVPRDPPGRLPRDGVQAHVRADGRHPLRADDHPPADHGPDADQDGAAVVLQPEVLHLPAGIQREPVACLGDAMRARPCGTAARLAESRPIELPSEAGVYRLALPREDAENGKGGHKVVDLLGHWVVKEGNRRRVVARLALHSSAPPSKTTALAPAGSGMMTPAANSASPKVS